MTSLQILFVQILVVAGEISGIRAALNPAQNRANRGAK
jgi:hypothetical protein